MSCPHGLPKEHVGAVALCLLKGAVVEDGRVEVGIAGRVPTTTGVRLADAQADNPHITRSDDGRCALWVGAVDDLWQFGKPRGIGVLWKDTAVRAGTPSDPYLMTGYDRKRLTLSHTSAEPVAFRVEADITGTGQWVTYREFTLQLGRPLEHRFPDAFAAYLVRVVALKETTATATFLYH
jgi:hypothetical protein